MQSSAQSSGSSAAAVVIILVMVAMAGGCSMLLGDPQSPAPASGLSLELFPARAPLNGAEETAVAARMTADMVNAQFAAATAEALRAESRMVEDAMRGTEFAYRVHLDRMTATANAIYTTATAESAGTSTAFAASRTQAVFIREVAATDSAATATQIAVEDEARRRAIDLQSSETMIGVWAVTKWAIPVFLLGLLGLLAYRWVWKKTEIHVIPADAKGKYPAVMKGGVVINSNLQAGAVEDLERPTPARESIKRGEQMVDMIRAMPEGARPELPQAPREAPEIEVIDAGADDIRPILDEVETKLLMQGGAK